MNSPTTIRHGTQTWMAFVGRDWVRMVAGGLLAEAAIIAIFVAVAFVAGRPAVMYSALAASFAVCVALGLVATLVYVALTLARPEPWVYVLGHGLKVLGAPAGAWRVAAERAFPQGRMVLGKEIRLKRIATL